MKKTGLLPLALAAASMLGFSAASAETIQAKLVGYNEVPSVSTGAVAHFKARINENAGSIFWELDYDGLQADATQSHIHFGQRHTNGGITVWLCANAPIVPPAGTQTCPVRTGHLSGTIMSANVVAPPATQQLAAGDFDNLVRALRAGATYANIHTATSPGGEVRGQIRGRDNDHDHHDHDHGHGHDHR